MKKAIYNKYLAKTLFGLEEVLAKELKGFGARDVRTMNRAVEFTASVEQLYRINLASRVALKVVKPFYSFTAENTDQLYAHVKKYNWHKLIKITHSFAIESVVNSSKITHSKYAGLKLKDAIVDQIRKQTGKRPNVNTKNPDFRIHLHIDKNKVNILLDSSGESLHKRGYRLSGEKAPLNEVLAAGMILLSGWDGTQDFIDPMCGSGTIAIEAALIAANMAPNISRPHFGFMKWVDFNKETFKKVKSQLILNTIKPKGKILANEINGITLKSAMANAKRAKVDNLISFSNEDFFNLQNPYENGFIITNPPYGERIKQTNINEFYKKFGDTLKKNFTGFDAWILSANFEALKNIGLRTSRRLHLYNGALETRFYNYQLYRGSKKKKYE